MNIYKAIKSGLVEEVKAIILNGFNLNSPDEYGDYPIHLAVTWGYLEIVNMLIDAKVDTNVKDSDGNTLLHLATKHNHPEIVKCILKTQPDTEELNNESIAALTIAYRDNNKEIIKILSSYHCPKIAKSAYEILIKNHKHYNLLKKKTKSILQQFKELMKEKEND